MSYANLVNEACAAGGQELFQRIRDFICKQDATDGTYDYSTTGIGWTLHDEDYDTDKDNLTSGDWIVIYSPGEGGKDDMYFKIDYQGDAAPHMYGYLYWNNSTHAGVTLYGGATYDMWTYRAGETIGLYIYGDLDAISIFPQYSAETMHQGAWCGRAVDGPYDKNIYELASGYSAGSAVDITLPSTPSAAAYAVGRNVYIRDDAHIEIIQVDAIAGAVITVDLVNSYTAGAKVSADHCYAVNTSANYCYVGSPAVYALIGRTGNVGGVSNGLANYYGAFAVRDLLQTAETIPVIPLLWAYPTSQYAGFAGRMPNVYQIGYYSGMTHNDLHVIDGVNYRYKDARYNVDVALKEV